MNKVFTTIGKIMAILFIIFTIAIVFIVYKNIDNYFTKMFAKVYVTLLFLFVIYAVIAIFLNVRRLKWKRIIKLFL